VKTPSTSWPSGCSLVLGNGSKHPVNKGAENAVFRGVGLLLVVVVPDCFDEGEFGKGEFAVDEGVQVELHLTWKQGHKIPLSVLILDRSTFRKTYGFILSGVYSHY